MTVYLKVVYLLNLVPQSKMWTGQQDSTTVNSTAVVLCVPPVSCIIATRTLKLDGHALRATDQ